MLARRLDVTAVMLAVLAALALLAGCASPGATSDLGTATQQVGESASRSTTPRDSGAREALRPSRPRTVTTRVRRLVTRLPVRIERRAGYDRDDYPHWSSQGRGCDTRDAVLAAESRRPVRVGADCTLSRGRWTSYYDGVRTRDSSSLDIDHLVPLAEAHDSGAHRWNASTREAFANDLGDARSLVAVSASSNRSKSDQDPREWLPPRNSCRYLGEYAAVKTRWSLSVDRGEKRALRRLAATCPNVKIRVRTVRVR